MDLFVLGDEFADLATLAPLATRTGGDVRNFSFLPWASRLNLTLMRFTTLRTAPGWGCEQARHFAADALGPVAAAMAAYAQCPRGWHGLARLRLSHELAAAGFLGSGSGDPHASDVWRLAGCDANLVRCAGAEGMSAGIAHAFRC